MADIEDTDTMTREEIQRRVNQRLFDERNRRRTDFINTLGMHQRWALLVWLTEEYRRSQASCPVEVARTIRSYPHGRKRWDADKLGIRDLLEEQLKLVLEMQRVSNLAGPDDVAADQQVVVVGTPDEDASSIRGLAASSLQDMLREEEDREDRRLAKAAALTSGPPTRLVKEEGDSTGMMTDGQGEVLVTRKARRARAKGEFNISKLARVIDSIDWRRDLKIALGLVALMMVVLVSRC